MGGNAYLLGVVAGAAIGYPLYRAVEFLGTDVGFGFVEFAIVTPIAVIAIQIARRICRRNHDWLWALLLRLIRIAGPLTLGCLITTALLTGCSSASRDWSMFWNVLSAFAGSSLGNADFSRHRAK